VTFPYFPRPYPDEVIGSLLTRACRHLGIPVKKLTRVALGLAGNYPSYLVGGQLPAIARLTGIPVDTLLWQHTVFPYLTAFMSQKDVERLTWAVLENQSGGKKTTASLQAAFVRRFCPECAVTDPREHGESYWHRAHLLPGVLICLIHEQPLQTATASDAKSNRWWTYSLPADAKGETGSQPAPVKLLLDIARESTALLRRPEYHRSDWHAHYRQLAIARGYGTPRTFEVAAHQLARDMGSFYGRELLSAAGCPLGDSLRIWPEIMIRERTTAPSTPVKHVLLALYLHSCGGEEKPNKRNKPGKKPIPRDSLDLKILAAIQKVLGESESRVICAKDLLAQAGYLSQFRHWQKDLPRTSAFIVAFRQSPRAKRRIKQQLENISPT